MQLPQKREFGWTLKPLDSAKTSVKKMPTGQIEVTIDHDIIRGVTTDMLLWWFQHFTTMTITYQRETYPAYYLWHPYDHVAATPYKREADRPLQAGDHLRIEEMFQRDPKYVVNEKALISTMDDSSMGLQAHALGQTLLDLRHSFENVDGGVHYFSRMLLGLEKGLLKPIINGLAVPRRFSDAKAVAWLTHNVEEVGCFENFLPQLYARRQQGKHVNLDE